MHRQIGGLLFLVAAFSSGSAFSIQLTIYDDGKSCPGNCDAQVVFHQNMNGSEYAHKPGTTAPNFSRCTKGEKCEICFESDNPSQCITVMYRGSGPPNQKFDFTPAFYSEWCEKSGNPDLLDKQCKALANGARALDGRVSCIQRRDHAICTDIMASAVHRQDADLPVYEECVRLGESTFNEGKPRSEQRIYGCAYEKESNGGPNANGKKWHLLLPGACREGTYVGRDGLDCCSGHKFVDAYLGAECKGFYPKIN